MVTNCNRVWWSGILLGHGTSAMLMSTRGFRLSAVPASKETMGHSFRTEVDVPPHSGALLEHSDGILLVGSCFSEHIGNRLDRARFNVVTNPFGVAFHPLPLARSLHRLASETPYTASDLNFAPTPLSTKVSTIEEERDIDSSDDSRQGLYYSLDHHSKYSHPKAERCLNHINADLALGARQLRGAKFMFLTLGTSWGYSVLDEGSLERAAINGSGSGTEDTETETDMEAAVLAGQRMKSDVVANCHRLPGKTFKKHMCSPSEAATALRGAILACQRVNPNLQVVLTVSPVRHWRDGPVENSRSKASLHLAIDNLVQNQLCGGYDIKESSRVSGSDQDMSPGENNNAAAHTPSSEHCVSYFPSYELVLDDLRDYRFFNEDMLHPSEVAIDYVWSKLASSFFSPEARVASEQFEALDRAAAHRPTRGSSQEANHRFAASQLKKMSSLKEQYPYVDLSDIEAHFKVLLH